MLGCTKDGVLNQSDFSKPLPWIGLYTMASTFTCTLAMAADVFSNFRHHKLWFPPKFFSLNATTLTFLGIATKLAFDLNTSMPRRQDQLAKLSSTALICTAIANFMPSLSVMSGSGIFSNVIALGIFVITVIINVSMQMGTGVIYLFLPEHHLILSFMLVLLLNLCSSTLFVTPAKKEMEDNYDSKCRRLKMMYDNKIRSHVADGAGPGSVISVVMECVKKCLLMAHTGNLSYVLGRSVTCTASGALCLVIPLVLMEASLRSFATDSVRFCGGTSDYKWSSMLIFCMQAIAVGVGTIAPAYRCFNTVNSVSVRVRSRFAGLDVWFELLDKWRNTPLPFQISSLRNRKIAHAAKFFILFVLVILQLVVVLVSSFICIALDYSRRMLKKLYYCKPSTSNEENSTDSNSDLNHFVSHLYGEQVSVELFTRSGIKYVDQWIERGKKQHTNLINELITKHSTENFKGVVCFDVDKVPSLPALLGSEEPPNCWALPVVTLTRIAVALSYLDQNLRGSVDSLVDAVSEGLRFVRFVDKHLDGRWLTKMREAADHEWLKVEHGDRYNSVTSMVDFPDYRNLLSGSLICLLWKLARASERRVRNFWYEDDENEIAKEALTANCLYRVIRTIMLDHHSWTTPELFEFLRMTISDILGACLTNLPRAVYTECIRTNAIKGGGEESVRGAALLLLEAEDILNFLGKGQVTNLYEGKPLYIDNWRKKRLKDPLCLPSTSLGNPSGSTPPDLSFSIK